MGCACNGGTTAATKWMHTSPDGVVTIKKHKYEVDWLLRRDGGTIEQVKA